MNPRPNLKIALMALLFTLILVVPVFAQEATSEAAPPESSPIAGVAEPAPVESATPGASALVLIVGLGAVSLVGFGAWMRERYDPQTEEAPNS